MPLDNNFSEKKLIDDVNIPAMGFGTWQITGDTARKMVDKALEVGYRHIDTAANYGNHREVGQALAESGLKREDYFLTTKIEHDNLPPDQVRPEAEKALEELGIDYIDLYLIHWPNSNIPIRDTLTAMQELQNAGLIKAIGVSNFTIAHLREALEVGVQITNNQVEYHPTLNQEDLRIFCHEQDITVTAYSPLARGEDLQLPEVKQLAEKYGRSEAQVVLNWLLNKGMIVIPSTSDESHCEANYQALEWTLNPEDVEKLNKLDQGNRLIKPDMHEFDKE